MPGRRVFPGRRYTANQGCVNSRRTAIDEKGLIGLILEGDRDLFADLVRVHGSRLYQLCLSYLSDPHEAEEAAHVSFIKAYKSLDRFRGDCAFGTWLFRIGINQCKDALKKRRRSRVGSLDEFLDKSNRVPEKLVLQPGKAIEEVVPSGALKRLSPGERDVLLKVAKDPEADYGEIGREMGLTREGFKGRLKRARMKIQDYLKNRGTPR